MKITLAVVGIISAAAVYTSYYKTTGANPSFLNEVPESVLLEEFAQYAAKYGKSYATVEEFHMRAQQYAQTKSEIMRNNASNGRTYKLGFNQFSDWTEEEFNAILGDKPTGSFVDYDSSNLRVLDASNLAATIDWRAKGVVNPVKNQASCGSCWSFGATAAIESHYAINYGKLHTLSEQQLVDCSRRYGNMGCNGGLAFYAYEYVQDYGQQLETSYPYTARDETCKYDKSKTVVGVSKYYKVTPSSPDQLKAALNQGPVSVSVDASGVFKSY